MGDAPATAGKRPRPDSARSGGERKAGPRGASLGARKPGGPQKERSWSASSRSDGRKGARPKAAAADGAARPSTHTHRKGPRDGGAAGASRGKAAAGDSRKRRPGKKITKEDAQRLRDERKSTKPYADVLVGAVRAWNELRERSCPVARKHALVDEIIRIIRGRVLEVAFRHDVSRVVQGCIKHGTPEQRDYVCKSLFGNVLALCKSKHTHQLVSKMLRYGSATVRATVHKEMQGSISRLMTHNLGAQVVEAGVARAWSPAQIWSLYVELFGPEYVNFPPAADVPRNLKAVLEARKADDKERRSTLEHMWYVLSKAADKRLLSLSLTQRLLHDFLSVAEPEQVVAAVTMVRDQLLSLVSTKEGAAAAAMCFAYATAKDRKQMLKGLKGHMLRVALHDHGHMTLIAALQVTDDTRLTTDAILDELRPHLPFLACHRFGRKVLLHLCNPKHAAYFSPTDVALLQPVTLPAYLATRKTAEPGAAADTTKDAAPKDAKASAGDKADGADGTEAAVLAIRVAFPAAPSEELKSDPVKCAPVKMTKKADDARCKELMTAIAADLESACLTHCALLARDTHGSAVLYEAACALSRLHGSQGDAYKRICGAIAELLSEEPSQSDILEQKRAMHAAVATALAGGIDTSAAAAAHAGDAEGGARKKARVVDGVDEADEAAMEEEPMEEDDGDDGGGDDDAEDDSDDDEAEGGAAAEAAPAEAVLPLFEHPPSHLLIKWLLLRESTAPVAAPAPAASGSSAASPGARPASVQHHAASRLPPSDKAVFGPALFAHIKGRLAALATSNRAFFILVELLSNRDTSVSSAALSELRSSTVSLSASPASPGKDVLLRLIGDAPKTADKTGKLAATAKPKPAAAAATKARKA